MANFNTDDEHTPPEVFEPVLESLGLEEFGTDPCTHPHALVPARTKYFGGLHNGLELPWNGSVWCNPPYSAPRPWVEKSSVNPSAMLLSADTSTRIWSTTIWPFASALVFLSKRVKFRNPANPTRTMTAKRPSVLVFFNVAPLTGPLRKLGKVVIL